MTDYEKILQALEWVNKVLDYFRPYKPETKSMTINYKTRDAEIEFVLHIPDNLKRKIRKVEIPAYQNFRIAEMRDECFNKIGGLWQFEDGKWKLNPSQLPPSEKYLIVLKGKLPEDALARIVYVQPAVNKDRTEEVDRYWLRSMIRNIEALEKLWNALSVDDVTASVRIGIERCLSTAIPKELKKRIEITREWIKVGRGRDREKLFRVWSEMRRVRETKASVDDIVDLIYKLTTGDFFSQFITIDDPYTLGEIRREETFRGTFPERMRVEACANLTLKQPIATGYLTFKKKEYTKIVEKAFSELI